MTLNLTYLKYFYDAVQQGNLTASAKKNFVTQSAISQGIMKLEHYFKKSLLTHRRNTIKLTPEGKKLFESSKRIFRCVDDVHESFIHGEDSYNGTLEIACYYSVAASMLPRALIKFQEIAPKVKLQFHTNRHDIIKGFLKKGEVEIAILNEYQNLNPFDYQIIHSGHFGVYESVDRKKNLPIDKCLFSEKSLEVFSLKNAYRKYYHKELLTHMEVGSWEVLVNLVIANVGVGFFPDYLAQVPYRQSLLRKSKLRYDPIPYNLYGIYPKGEKLSKNAELFLKCFS